MVEFSYAVDTTNMHGDAFTDMAGPQPGEDAVTVAATVNNTGAIAITQAGVVAADDGATVTYQFPDGGQMTVTAADQTVNYTLSPLWLSKYGRNNILEEVLDGLVRASSSGGTHVIVDLTGSVAPSAQTAPIDSTPIEGPFNAFGTEFWVNTDTCKVGFDVDNDPDADTWFTWAEIDGNDDISDESKMAYKAQLEALGCTT